MREHHIGIITKNIRNEISVYSKLGYSAITDIIYDDIQHNYILLLKNKSSFLVIELIEPADVNSTVYKSAEGYHHICYEADSEDEVRSVLKKRGVGVVFSRMIKAIALDNRMVCFAMLQNGTIIEFVINSKVGTV